MLTQPHEVDEAMLLLAQARQELASRGEPVAEHIPVGGMIEVPAAALSAGIFASKLDFLAIGTNDLVSNGPVRRPMRWACVPGEPRCSQKTFR